MNSGLQQCLTYTKAKLGEIATDPYICARYFDYLMNVFIEVVLNWNMEAGCTRAEGGLFDCTTAFFAAAEAQNSTGSLHTHMLICIKDMPATVDDYYAMCAFHDSETPLSSMWMLLLQLVSLLTWVRVLRAIVERLSQLNWSDTLSGNHDLED
ncbi:hypothetical protein F441_04729 [Phytophthora nicotianae CJ01A1]|uniref:Helitron helicase-like domain-containing protein n=1 Tax=Phytophthora nicotianae CJ01A1 TaxID=1317063 RepID=W2XH72_PHYNI|nr:hypothetical protein F441_04729 [Phytophthora nicotianae CJ01A1]